MLIIVVTGIYSTIRMPLELTPEVELPQLTITTTWPGASAEAVEGFITAPVEGAVAALPAVQEITSTSNEGRSSVVAKFREDTAMDFISLQLSEQLALIRENLPHGAHPPKIENYVPKEFQHEAFLQYQVTGDYSLYEMRQMALEKLRAPLLSLEGIASVSVIGGQDAEIQILLDRDKMVNLGLSLSQVRTALTNLNVRVQAGVIRKGARNADLVVVNQINSIPEISQLSIRLRNRVIQLGDIAEVRQSYQNVRNITRIDGNPSVQVRIVRKPGSNTIDVADRVFLKLEELVQNLPPGVRLININDQSARIRDDLRGLTIRSIFCMATIFLVLMAFLRNMRLPALVLATVFVSVLLTLNFFYFAGLTLNILTLAGLALGFGMLVDNVIVVIENIHRLREDGMPQSEAAVKGTQEMATPLFASTVTTIVVLIPFLYFENDLRVMYLPFTIAVCLSLLASLLIAFTFTPVIAARIAPGASMKSGPLQKFYGMTLRGAMRVSILPILAVIGLFYWSYSMFDENVTKGEIWKFSSGQRLYVSVRLPKGAQMQRADDIARVFEDKLVGLEGVERISTRVFQEGMFISISFIESEEYSSYPYILKEEVTVIASRFAGINISVYGLSTQGFYNSGISGSSSSFRIKVLGYNYEDVRRIAEDVGAKLKTSIRVRNVNTSGSGRWWNSMAQNETLLEIDRKELPRYGLSVQNVIGQVTSWLRENQQQQSMRIGNRELTYRVKFDSYEEFDLSDFQTLALHSPRGQVRLRDVARIIERPVQSEITRENQQYQRWVTFEYRGPHKFGKRVVDGIIQGTALPPGYKLEHSRWSMGEDELQQIYFVFGLSILLVFMVTASLYESLLQPFIIMLTVPLGLIGVFLAFWLTETNFSRSAYIGVILLSGIVVNNAILLVERISRMIREGYPRDEAIWLGAMQRLRPILMTTSTTVLGLMPLFISGGEEKLWGALTLATIGGLSSSTLLVLFVAPCLYKLLIRDRAKA